MRGTPVLYLVARLTAQGRYYCRPSVSGYKDIDFLENYLIGAALAHNPDLLNKRGTKLLREICVPGILNSRQGNPGRAAVDVRQILGL